jgi:hypothetical protein
MRGAPMAKVEDQPIVTSTTQARAGVTGHNVRYVLVFGTVGVAVLFAALMIYSFGLHN